MSSPRRQQTMVFALQIALHDDRIGMLGRGEETGAHFFGVFRPMEIPRPWLPS